jgi:hypothetical protein
MISPVSKARSKSDLIRNLQRTDVRELKVIEPISKKEFQKMSREIERFLGDDISNTIILIKSEVR